VFFELGDLVFSVLMELEGLLRCGGEGEVEVRRGGEEVQMACFEGEILR
jgi:hypothetical protein